MSHVDLNNTKTTDAQNLLTMAIYNFVLVTADWIDIVETNLSAPIQRAGHKPFLFDLISPKLASSHDIVGLIAFFSGGTHNTVEVLIAIILDF